MERQSAALSASPRPSAKTPANPPSSAPSTPGSSGAGTSNRRRKNKNGGALFGILRIFAIMGPIGFGANIVYFQVYFPYHERHPQDNPFRSIAESVTGRHRLMADDDDTNDSNNNNNHAGNLPSTLSGTAVLKRLQNQAAFSFKECGSSSQATLDLRNQLIPPSGKKLRGATNSRTLLEPFAFKDAFLAGGRKYGRRLEQAAAASNTTTTTTTTTLSRAATGIQNCNIPQKGSLECKVYDYSIIVTFQGENNFRQLFMNLLSFLTYPSVSDIIVLMPHNDWGYEGQTTMDVKYKERLKAWHNDKQHKLSMIGLPPTLQDEPTSRYSFETIVHKVVSKIQSKAILFMDGSTLWNGNIRGIHAGFELWKQHPHAMVATHKLSVTTETCPTDHYHGNNWASFCQSSSSALLPSDMTKLHRQYQNVLDMNGVFVHRDMLCLLQQAPLSTVLIKSLWRVLDDFSHGPQATSAYIRAIMATTLLQISGQPPLLFPPRIARPKNETQDYNDNWHYLATKRESDLLEAIAANNTDTQQRVLVELLGYFGTGLTTDLNTRHIPYWCASQKKVDDVFFMTDLTWTGLHSKCPKTRYSRFD